MGTIIEGELTPVLGIVQQCIELLAADYTRVTASVKLDYRDRAAGRIASKVASVESKLQRRAAD